MDLTENQKAWVAALRSGEFKQANHTLEYQGSYCCLGVLCVVAEKHGVEVRRLDSKGLRGTSLLHQPEVKQWVGMNSNCGTFGSQHVDYLTVLNDEGKTFAEIADIIEQNAESLFTNNVPN